MYDNSSYYSINPILSYYILKYYYKSRLIWAFVTLGGDLDMMI